MLLEKVVPTIVPIESVNFTGGIDSGRDVVDWIKERGGNAVWQGRSSGLKGYPDLPEHICISKGSSRTFAWIGDSVTICELGKFRSFKLAS